MAEPELAFAPKSIEKTMDDLYGRHALVHVEGQFVPAGDGIDVNWLVPAGPAFHPTRMNDDYQPRHAAGPVAECNTDEGGVRR